MRWEGLREDGKDVAIWEQGSLLGTGGTMVSDEAATFHIVSLRYTALPALRLKDSLSAEYLGDPIQ